MKRAPLSSLQGDVAKSASSESMLVVKGLEDRAFYTSQEGQPNVTWNRRQSRRKVPGPHGRNHHGPAPSSQGARPVPSPSTHVVP